MSECLSFADINGTIYDTKQIVSISLDRVLPDCFINKQILNTSVVKIYIDNQEVLTTPFSNSVTTSNFTYNGNSAAVDISIVFNDNSNKNLKVILKLEYNTGEVETVELVKYIEICQII